MIDAQVVLARADDLDAIQLRADSILTAGSHRGIGYVPRRVTPIQAFSLTRRRLLGETGRGIT